MCNKSIELTATQSGAQETKNVLSSVNVKTSKVHVGSATYEEQIPDDSVDVIVGVFFDGTLNNRDNTNARIAYETAAINTSVPHPQPLKLSPEAKKYEEVIASMKNKKEQKNKMGSYENDLSNIGRMEPAYPETSTKKVIQTKVYIEGIATFNYGTDDKDGMGFGTGAAGILKKVEKACIDIGIQVGKLLRKNDVKKIKLLQIDVFGFSRGAAAARNFVSEINKQIGNNKTIFNAKDFNEFEEKLGYDGGQKQQKYQHRFGELGEQLAGNGIKEVKMLGVRFAGLYETVASYGYVHYNDTKDLNLKAIGRANHVLQLVAQDEHRENFVITNIKSAASKGVTCYLPGVHSDIGGGYTLNAKEEQLIISEGNEGNTRNRMTITAGIKKLRTQLIHESWYSPKQITIDQYSLIVNRVVASNRYSYIPLHIMVEYANKKQLKFNFTLINKDYPLKEEKSISTTTAKGTETYCCNLATIKERLDQHVYNGADAMRFTNPADQNMLRLIRTHYIHTSAHYNNKVAGGLYAPHKPHKNYTTRRREENDG